MDKSKFESDRKRLMRTGDLLQLAMAVELEPENKKAFLGNVKEVELPVFEADYQSWYTESLALISQLLPVRADDFIGYYKPRPNRKDISHENYTVSDYLQGLRVTRGLEEVVGRKAAFSKFIQQLMILKALSNRFDSSLYDIRAVFQASLFDNELDASQDLLRHGHMRAAGAVAGVVLEGHLKEICAQHSIKQKKKTPSLADYNDALKDGEVIETAIWRNIQYLGDIRNLCDHKKDKEPTSEQVQDLIDGARKITKSLF